MGQLVNRRVTTVAACVVAAVIIALNVFLLAQTFGLAVAQTRTVSGAEREGRRRRSREGLRGLAFGLGPPKLAALEVAERVDRVAVDADLEVEVRAGAVAGAADVADHLALAHLWPQLTAIDDWWPYAVARSPPLSRTTRLP